MVYVHSLDLVLIIYVTKNRQFHVSQSWCGTGPISLLVVLAFCVYYRQTTNIFILLLKCLTHTLDQHAVWINDHEADVYILETFYNAKNDSLLYRQNTLQTHIIVYISKT